MIDATCPVCDGDIPTKGRTGPRRIYCSRSCRDRACYLRLKARGALYVKPRVAHADRKCALCGSVFTPKTRRSRVCYSPDCRRRARSDSQSRLCSEIDCGRPHRAKGLCNMHYRRAARAAGAQWVSDVQVWDERRRANWKKRYALTRGADDAESFDYREIFERDNWTCGICSKPVDPDVKWPDPLSASLDHVVAVTNGGSHTRGNAQCAHLRCNVSKGNRAA